ncbi:MAG TPA: neutral/alkaline non-lysosomal ceramidase N-terminal domain-containing protein [Bacillota bacterium]|jgi:neutral ceramidase|nr:neutral/alkaline non-lysosomal ceramidase N-terminal domain-containing protein [Bacillota bacterium]HQD52792.1 neutral/alkaline non-lysosomal ceramidase N-terminal domain-containing protein [Bacillota bacterium]
MKVAVTGKQTKWLRVTMLVAALLCLQLVAAGLVSANSPAEGVYNIGAGIHDITGPAAEVRMMGYADTDQITAGIHTRLWSRAFVIEEPSSGNRVVYVTADIAFITQGIQQQVIEKLQNKYGDLYTEKNVLLNATHTHSGPGGYSHYALYNFTILGFIKENFDCIVDGIYRSIEKAHLNLEPGYIKINSGELDGVTINRSPQAYLNNSAAERAKYLHDVDRVITVIKFESLSGEELGIISWFPIHCTSMGKDNGLISGDNKGYASYLYEKYKGTDYSARKTFIAAFAQSNEGDTSPNIYGGEEGYGENDFESTAYAGRRQFEKALELADSATELIVGSVDFRHKFADFSDLTVALAFADGEERHTAPAALGYSFAAGAEDGPSGIDMFHEGMTTEDYPIDDTNIVSIAQNLVGLFPVLNKIVGINYPWLWPLHEPKPILFATSQAEPYPWTPEVLPVQIIKIGQLKLLAVPGEFTTMSGRRLTEEVQSIFGDSDGLCLIAGPSNAYADYIATREEYLMQHYEGASTIFGPWTLAAFIQEFVELATAMTDGTEVESGPVPRDLRDEQMNFQTGVVLDNTPIGKKFGDIVVDVNNSYYSGDTATVTFWGGHPKNDLKTGSTFLEVQRLEDNQWITVASDWDWETCYIWKRKNALWGSSQVTIKWDIPLETQPGTYRIVHYGNYKNGWNGKIYPYTGTSSTFTLN